MSFPWSGQFESASEIPLPNERNDPPDLQQVYGRFTSSATGPQGLEVPSFEDCIAALVICPEHRKMALSYQLDDGLAWFPIAPLKSASYSDSIKSLLGSAFPTIEFKVPKVIQKKRFQVPAQLEYVNLTLYKVELNVSGKTENCVCLKSESAQKSSPISWEPYEKIESMADCLAGPEPLVFARLLLKNQQISSKDYSALQEYSLKPIESWYCSPSSEMVRKCAGIEDSVPVGDFLLLYGDYLKHCYPSPYMTFTKFKSYLSTLPLYSSADIYIEKRTFTAFDVDKRKYLDFYQLVTGLALMDPTLEATQEYEHSNRVEYIYRFYNRDDHPEGIQGDECDEFCWDLNILMARQPNSDNKSSDVPCSPISLEGLIEYSRRNPACSLLFRSVGRVIQKLVSSLVVNKKKNKSEQFKLECDYIKIDSNLGKLVGTDFIPYPIEGGLFKNVNQVSCNPQDNFEQLASEQVMLSNDEHVNDFLLQLIRQFVHSPSESPWNELDYRVSILPYILHLCESVKQIFSQERRLLRIDSPCYVFGDIHGSVQDIANFDTVFWRMGPNILTDNYLLLGDYVDRGAHSIECIMYLFVYKVLAPEHFYLIRGNHEEERVNEKYGFKAECLRKFGLPEGLMLWTAVNEAFNVMPFCALVGEQIFAAHGGFPGPVAKLAQIEASIPTYLAECYNTLAEQLFWNDPIGGNKYYAKIASKFKPVRWGANKNPPENFLHNSNRGCGLFYTEAAVDHFLSLNRLSHVIRAHEFLRKSYKCDFDGRVITVFSSSNYCGVPNKATLALVTQEKRIQIIQMNPSTNTRV